MYSTETLPIKGYRDEAVPNVFFKCDAGTRHAAMLLPGMGYKATMPLIYYPRRLMMDLGADVLVLEYDYDRAAYRDLDGGERLRWLAVDVSAAYRSLREQGDYDQLTLVGKSIGTLGMGHTLTTEDLPEAVYAVWLTPLLRLDMLRAQIAKYGGASLFATGTADPHYDADRLAEVVAATNGEAIVVPEANHSLEVPGEVMGSVKAMEQVLSAMKAHLRG